MSFPARLWRQCPTHLAIKGGLLSPKDGRVVVGPLDPTTWLRNSWLKSMGVRVDPITTEANWEPILQLRRHVFFWGRDGLNVQSWCFCSDQQLLPENFTSEKEPISKGNESTSNHQSSQDMLVFWSNQTTTTPSILVQPLQNSYDNGKTTISECISYSIAMLVY